MLQVVGRKLKRLEAAMGGRCCACYARQLGIDKESVLQLLARDPRGHRWRSSVTRVTEYLQHHFSVLGSHSMNDFSSAASGSYLINHPSMSETYQPWFYRQPWLVL